MNNLTDAQVKAYKAQLHDQYEHICGIFGIGSRSWTELHRKPSPYAFCPANQKSFIAEYLMLEEFVEDAKKVDFAYYYGIDDFLEAYRDVVYKRVKIDSEC